MIIFLFCAAVVGIGSVLLAELVVLVFLGDCPPHQGVRIQQFLRQGLVNAAKINLVSSKGLRIRSDLNPILAM